MEEPREPRDTEPVEAPETPFVASKRIETSIPSGDIADEKVTTVKEQPTLASLAGGEKATQVEHFENRLRQIWVLAHQGAPSEEGSFRARDYAEFLRGIREVIDPAGFIDERFLAAMTQGATGDAGLTPGDSSMVETPGEEAGIAGDVSTVSLIVGAALERLGDAEDVRRFARGPLAQTMGRLERENQGTREERVDIVIRALRRLAGRPNVAEMAVDLLGYLDPQRERGPGYYVTVGNLSGLVTQTRGLWREEAFLLHYVLRGMWRLAMDGALTELDRMSSSLVRSASYNSTTIISIASQRQRQSEPPAGIRDVIEPLATIAVSSSRPIALDEDRAAAILAALGLDASRPVDTLTAISLMGEMPMAWGERSPDLALLEAASAVALAAVDPAAAEEQGGSTPARLFNAGVSLAGGSVKLEPRVELLVNALGLSWALKLGDDLIAALRVYDGLDCAVNLLGTIVEYLEGDAGPPEERSAIERLGRHLAGLPRWPPLLGDAAIELDLARMAAAARRLRFPGNEPLDRDGMARAVEGVIDALRPPEGDQGADPVDDVLDTAHLIRHAFSAVDRQRWSMWPKIQERALLRDDPLEVLRDRYARYVDPSPFVLAGVITEPEWAALASRLLQPRNTVVPLLLGL